MSLQLTTPPSLEPVTLAEAKAHLKIDTSDDDALIATLIAAARARAEWHTGRALITQGWTLWLDTWRQVISIPLPPLQTVASVTTYARDDSAHVLDAATYLVDAAANRLALKQSCAPPTDLRRLNAVAIAFTAGYGSAAADVPAPLREAVLELVAFLYENRGDAPAELPQGCLALLAPYRVLKL
ncbi:MAG TPA: head-tail connector protein [Rhizomicrobium sp.]